MKDTDLDISPLGTATPTAQPKPPVDFRAAQTKAQPRNFRPPVQAAVAGALCALRRAGYGEGEILDALAEVLEAEALPTAQPRTIRAEVAFVVPPISEAERAAAREKFLAEHGVTRLPPGFAEGVGHTTLALRQPERKPNPPRAKTKAEIAALLADLDLDL